MSEEKDTFLTALLSKFPAFDPAWGAEQQQAWFAAYGKLLSIGLQQASPKAHRAANGDSVPSLSPWSPPSLDEAIASGADDEMAEVLRRNSAAMASGAVKLPPPATLAETVDTTVIPQSERKSVYGFSNK